jgi:hypothetical protein
VSNFKKHDIQVLGKFAMLDMKLKGYGYAIAGDVNDPGYYQKTVGAIEIPESSPGIYKNRVKTAVSA